MINAIKIGKTLTHELQELGLDERLKYLARLKSTILAKREMIIDRVQSETGKCRTDALVAEIFSVLDHIHFLEKKGKVILSPKRVGTPLALMGKKSFIHFDPLGVVLIISPWNYPFHLGMIPCTTAFLAGNAVVFKPSEYTPLKGLMEELFHDAGFKSDWIQVVYGDGEVAKKLIDDKPDKIFFTGSQMTGQKILSQVSSHLIPVDLELGGKDPMIVFEDANIDRAVAGALWGAFTNTGQACTSVERLYIHRSIYSEFRTLLLERTQSLKVDTDRDGSADLGKMTTDFQVKKIKAQLEDAKMKGYRQLTGNDWNGTSRLIPPIVVEGSGDTLLLKEETFGPVLPIIPFDTEEEVIQLANQTEFGLSASVWTKDMARAMRVTRKLITGNVSINNVMLTEGNAELPFGGAKKSGFGRSRGAFGLYAYTNIKSVIIDRNAPKIETNWYPYTPKKYRLLSDLIVFLFRGGFINLIRFIVTGLLLENYSTKAWKTKA